MKTTRTLLTTNLQLMKNEHLKSMDYKMTVIAPSSEIRELIELKNSMNNLTDLVLDVKKTQEKDSNLLEKTHNSVDKIHDHLLNPKQKPKKPDKVQKRQAISPQFFKQMVNSPREKHEKALSHARFRVAITLLFFFGPRVNEIKNLTLEDFEKLYKEHYLLVYQPKTNSTRRLVLGKKSLYYFKKIEKDVDLVFLNHNTLGGDLSNSSWTFFINQRLKFYKRKYNNAEHYLSHSFRIHFITNLLKTRSLQRVAMLAGHKDVRNTLIYDRTPLSDAEISSAVDSLIN